MGRWPHHPLTASGPHQLPDTSSHTSNARPANSSPRVVAGTSQSTDPASPGGGGGCRPSNRFGAGAQLTPQFDDLLLQVNHALDAHRGQSDELHDRRPTLVLAGEGFVKLLEFVDELLTDYGFGIEIYPSDSPERREIVDFFGLGRHVVSLARPMGHGLAQTEGGYCSATRIRGA